MSIKTTRFLIFMIISQIVIVTTTLFACQTSKNKPFHKDFIQKTQRVHIPFITNRGQIHDKVKYYANTFAGKVFITRQGEIVYSLPGNNNEHEIRACDQKSGIRETNFGPRVLADGMVLKPKILCASLISYRDPISKIVAPCIQDTISQTTSHQQKSSMRGLALKETLVGGKIDTVQGQGKALTQVSYFRGNDSSGWKRNISAYDVVNLGEVYKGITLKLRAYGCNVEKLFYLEPHADPEAITINLSGAHALNVNSAGQLEVKTDLGTVRFTKPVAYQEINGTRVDVPVRYEILELGIGVDETGDRNWYSTSGILNHDSVTSAVKYKTLAAKSLNNRFLISGSSSLTYGFKVASYDKAKELIIDPLLASTYLGGVESDHGNSIAIDAAKNIYVAGYTKSSDFPTTTGVFDLSYNNGDIFISKLNGDLTQLLASTFLGGSSEDYVRSMAIDAKNNVYLTGQTTSSDFPITDDAYDTSKNGYSDAFLVKVSGDLTCLLASTFLGGSSDDNATSIALDPSGIILCVTGRTLSSNFPTTSGVYDTGYKNGDAFISKLDWTLTNLLASTYLGGTANDFGNSIAIDSQRNIYVTGDTWSFDFPTTMDTYDSSFNGGFGDAFISKLNWDLTHVLASTYLGGTTDDSANAMVIDSQTNIFVVGQTESFDFPTTASAYEKSFRNGDAFVSKINGNLTKLLASTYLGGADDDIANSIAIGPDGNIYVSGYTGSSDFPITPGSYDTTKGIFFDVFVSKLNAGLASLSASTFIGGDYRDIARSLVVDRTGNVYVTGETLSSNFPVTSKSYDTSYNGDVRVSSAYDAFVLKLDSNLSALPAATK